MVTAQHIAWLNDKRLMRYSEQRHRRHTMATQKYYLNGLSPDGMTPAFIWLVRDLADDVGTITAHIDPPNNVANMGILIAFPGRGYGVHAWRKAMGWLRAKGVRKVECGCMRSNAAMINLATKAGMTPEGKVPGHFMLDGKPEDMLLFGVML